MTTNSIIQIDLATIRNLASPALAEEMRKSDERMATEAEQLKQDKAAVVALEASILSITAQEAALAAKRNAANDLADQKQREMVEALSAGQDIEKLSDEYAAAVAAAARTHAIIASCDTALLQKRPELERLKESIRSLENSLMYSTRNDGHYAYRLAFAEFMRQASMHFDRFTMQAVHERGITFAGPQFGEYVKGDLAPADEPGRPSLDKMWAELEAMDAAKVETVKAFVTEQPTKTKGKAKAAQPEAAPAQAEEAVALGEGLPVSDE